MMFAPVGVRFRKKNWWRRNVCQLLPYEGHGHGFFNFNFDVRLYEHTLNDLDRFLVACGFPLFALILRHG